MNTLHIIFLAWISLYLTFVGLYVVVPFFKKISTRDFYEPRNNAGISIIMPAYNEAKTFGFSVPAISMLDYENYEVIIVNDGSTDNSMEMLNAMLELQVENIKYNSTMIHMPILATYRSIKYPNIMVVDKINGGKSDALNAGTSVASNEIIVLTDADSILKRDSLRIIDRAFENENVLCAGGSIRVLQSSNNNSWSKLPFLVRIQTIGYIRGFLQFRLAFAILGTLPLISGAFGIYRKSALISLGGHNTNTVGEDMDLTFRAHALAKKLGKKIAYLPHAICYTECPETWRVLYNQRVRWQKGFIDCFIIHRGLLFNKKPLLTVFMWFQALLLETLTPILAIVLTPVFLLIHTNWIWGIVNNDIIVACALITQSIAAVFINTKFGHMLKFSEYIVVLVTAILELFIFPMANAVFAIAGIIKYFTNKRSWSHIERTGITYESLFGGKS